MKLPLKNSLVSEVVSSLRESILTREFGAFLPSVRILSRDLHVSVPTILKAIQALDLEGLVDVEKRKRVKILHPRRTKSKLKKQGNLRVVFLTFGASWIAGSLYYQTVINELFERNFAVRIFECGEKNPTVSHLEQMVVAENAVCWVLFGAPAEVQAFFAERKLTCIMDGVTAKGLALPDFEVDYAALYRHAVNHLRMKGHHRISLIVSEESAERNAESIAVFRQCVRQSALGDPAWNPVQIYDGTGDDFKAAMERLFERRQQAPTALITTMVKRLVTAMTWLMSRNLQVPGDVSIISRDYDDILECLHPLPAHYRQPQSTPKRFVRAIMSVMAQKHTLGHIRVITEFNPGKTIASPGST